MEQNKLATDNTVSHQASGKNRPDHRSLLRKAEQFMLSEFGSLTVEQLNWSSDAENWSIGQCLDHIVVTDTLYFPVFDAIREGRYKMSFWGKWSPFSGMFGRMLIDQMGEVATKKYKSPASFRPDTKPLGLEVIRRFSKHQDSFVEFIESLQPGQDKKIRISSPASKLITYSVADAVQMLVQHQYRHLNQAIRVKNQHDFPR